MKPKLLKKVKPGESLTAMIWNELIDYLNRVDLCAGPQSGIELQAGPEGTMISVLPRGDRLLCVANGAIAARSGTTPGTGNVFLVNVNGTTLSTTTISYPVYNPSSSTMTSTNGIDSGQYCLIEEVPSGKWLVTPLECA